MGEQKFIETSEILFTPGGREVLRLKADGTRWIAPDITEGEIRQVLPELARIAAEGNKARQDCKEERPEFKAFRDVAEVFAKLEPVEREEVVDLLRGIYCLACGGKQPEHSCQCQNDP